MEDGSEAAPKARTFLGAQGWAWSGFITILIASTSAAWIIRGEVTSSRLADYEAAKALKLSDAVKELQSFAATIKPSIDERRSMERLAMLEPQLVEKQAQLKEAATEIERLRSALEKVTRKGVQTVEIPERGSARLIPNGALVGVSQIFANRCELSYANTKRTFDVGEGEGRRDPTSGLNYEFVLTKVLDESCVIDFEVLPLATKTSRSQ